MRQKLLWTKVNSLSFITLTIAPYGKPVKLDAMEGGGQVQEVVIPSVKK